MPAADDHSRIERHCVQSAFSGAKGARMTRLPTTDLYFLNACGHAVSHWWKRGPVERLGPNCFLVGDTVVLIRQDSNSLMRQVRENSSRLIYLIDDDIERTSTSLALPSHYRERLIRFHEDHHLALTKRADVLVVTSPVLKARFAWHRDVRLLHPVWHLPIADDSHFGEIERGGPIRAVHLGSGSHAAGLAFLEPVVGELLQRYSRLNFTYVGHGPGFETLDRHPRVNRIRPQSWRRYRKWIGRQRFHLGLYPVPDTPFDMARSHNKLLEYGVVGAVGVYSKSWPAARQVNGGAIVAGEQPEWIEAISSSLATPEKLRALAATARPALDRLNEAATQRGLWSELLDVAF